MEEVVVSFRVPVELKRELYRALGEAQARKGERVEIKRVAAKAIALAIADLRGELPSECNAAAEKLLVSVRG